LQLRLLIVDDASSMRLLVKQYLHRIPEFSVVGEAIDGPEAIEKSVSCQPDIILMDISLSGTSGIEVARKIKAIRPETRIYLFSAYEIDEISELDLNSPADGFISKSKIKNDLLVMLKNETKWREQRKNTIN
jgi:DNA-binding NarL/FixJ family response regulator